MERQVIGILAHVDAGKTTLSEGILYTCKKIRKLGRVDKKDAFLDNYALERERGITIYSKQAVFEYGGVSFTLIDTPGHVDFSTEMERALQVLDMAILVISGPEGVQAHTRTLWKLLSVYDIPTFVFVNKMDRPGVDADEILSELKNSLSTECIRLDRGIPFEDIAVNDETLLEKYLEAGELADEDISDLIARRTIFPCYFGSALECSGVEELLSGLSRFAPPRYEDTEFAARVYKIGRDEEGNRLTHLKLTGGTLKVRDSVTYVKREKDTGASVGGEESEDGASENTITEKVNQLRVYDGEKYTTVQEAEPGMVVAIMGLTQTFSGQTLGAEEEEAEANLVPVMTVKVLGANDKLGFTHISIPPKDVLPMLRALEEEDPSLHVEFNTELRELQISIMGDIQLEIIKSRLYERFGKNVLFDKGSILYKETVAAPVIGVGHFEPLRHYAEVQLLIEPGEKGSGITFKSEVSVNDLELNWQRLIMTHVFEREHKGVLTGAVLTDVCFTLVAGRSHIKHTMGGDFRQATYRAIRQGLMKAENLLLEPFYEFTIELPSKSAGRAMNDINRRFGKITSRTDKSFGGEDVSDGEVILTGIAPASTMQGYQKELSAYTGGLGSYYSTFYGYLPCHNTEEIVAAAGYVPEADLRNPASSVFCAHGAGFVVEWYEVDNYKHLEPGLPGEGVRDAHAEYEQAAYEKARNAQIKAREGSVVGIIDRAMSYTEVDEIINRTVGANRKSEHRRNPYRKHREEIVHRRAATVKDYSNVKPQLQKEKYLLVDGYNIIYSWSELKSLLETNVDSARDCLNEILSDYCGLHDIRLIVVYDAYRVAGHLTENLRYHNINIVYTAQAETADKYIERFAHENSKQYDVTVATSDGLEQIIIRGAGCKLMTALDLQKAVKDQKEGIAAKYLEKSSSAGTVIKDVLDKLMENNK